jgi:hypothetical protein
LIFRNGFYCLAAIPGILINQYVKSTQSFKIMPFIFNIKELTVIT